MFLSIENIFAMNQSLNITKNLSYKEQSILKSIEEQMQKGRNRSLDEIIFTEFCYGGLVCSLREQREILMSLFPKINAKNSAGHGALAAAIYDGDLELTKYLIENGAETTDMDNDKRTAIMRAIRFGRHDIALYLAEQGHTHSYFKERWTTDTELLKAIEEGYLDVVKCLIKYGADVDFSNKWGDTPLMRAIRKGYFDIAEYLIEQGAKVSAKDNKGQTAKDFIKDGVNRIKNKMECLLERN